MSRPRVILDQVGLAAEGAKYSIEVDQADLYLQLVGDEIEPGNEYFYGTNASGLKGWYAVAAISVADSSVTNAKLATMTQATIKGRAAAAGTGNPQDLTAAQVKTLLAFAASEVTFSPTGSIAATTVQTAIAELDTEKQPIDSDLTTIAAISASNDDVIQRKVGAWTNRTMAQLKTDLVLVKGDVNLGSADNTSDTDKPVSTATATALTGKLSLTGGTMSGAIAMGANSITGLADGANPQDAVTKNQLDNATVTVWGLVTVSGTTYTLLATNTTKIHNFSNTGARAVTVPLANTVDAGKPIWIKDSAGTAGIANITLTLSGSDTFEDGVETSFVIAGNNDCYGIYSNGGTKWHLI